MGKSTKDMLTLFRISAFRSSPVKSPMLAIASSFITLWAVGLAFSLASTSTVYAQGQTNTPPSTEPVNELDALSTPSPAPLPPAASELDALSGTEEDPFGEEIVQRQRKPVSVTLRALDKIIARTVDLDVPMNELAKFGTLEIVPRYCDKRPPEDFPETTAFLEIYDNRPELPQIGEKNTTPSEAPAATPAATSTEPAVQSSQAPAPGNPTILADGSRGPSVNGDQIFSGWMFASSPGLNGLEHPVYDVWVIGCSTQLVDQDASSEDPSGN